MPIKDVLSPRSVAVIGASSSGTGIGYQIVDNLLMHGFTGPVYPIHPTAESIHSIKAYKSVEDVPGPVDLGVIVVPSSRAIGAVRDCVAAGVKGLVVITAGFKEVGGDGKHREKELIEALGGDVRMIGPNCMGVINTNAGVAMNATFAPTMPPAGGVALMSQSGAMGLSILDYAGALGIGLSSFVSAGNKADVDANDVLEYWRDDEDSNVILMYLENIDEPRRFVDLGNDITRTKPIVVVKSGRTGAGARAAASHTGALAQTELATDSLIQQAGAIRAQTVEELFDLAMAFANQPLPQGNRVAIVTNAGGPGIIIADACDSAGLEVTGLTEETQAKLREKLPVEASVRNPVDMIASADAVAYEHALKTVLADPGVDAAIAAFVPPLGVHARDIANAIVAADEKFPDKPVLAVFMGREGLRAGMDELHESNVPAYIFPESAARALGSMWKYKARLNRTAGSVQSHEADDELVEKIIADTLAAGSNKVSEVDSMRILEAYGIAVAPWSFIEFHGEVDGEALAGALEQVGLPVALKVVSPGISHKTDVGGVVLNLETRAEVEQAMRDMVERLGGDNEIAGFMIQRMASGGRETIVGLTRMPGVGPMVMFGLGGVYVEVLRDVVLRLAPVTDVDAQDMVQGVRMYQLLEGIRGEPPRDQNAIQEVITRVSQLATRHPRVIEMDINPLLALEHGVLAVDARIQLE